MAVRSEVAPTITAAMGEGIVRFSARGEVCQIRAQIMSANGESIFDSAWKDGDFLDWRIENPGQPLVSGSYRCFVMVKDLEGHVTQREATLTSQGGQIAIERRGGNDALAVANGNDNGPKITMLAHDGANGAIVSTAGDLSFRFGNFLASKDSERMRLTAEGNLGIGTDKPQAPLDVIGLIRTSKGIMFPDGTMLTTAAGLPGAIGNGDVISRRSGTPVIVRGGVEQRSQPPSATASVVKPLIMNTPDYQFKVDSLGVHIGTTSAFGLDVAGNVNLSSNLALPSTASGSAGVITIGGNRFAHSFGSANTFVGPSAGNFTMTGHDNTGNGNGALYSNTSGVSNTASGSDVLVNNLSGARNTAIGGAALFNNSTGSDNIAVGANAGLNLTFGDNNIDIGAGGIAAEANTIRIGTVVKQTKTFIAGIRFATVGADAINVFIDSTGQLGTTASSRRYKFDINSMDASTDGLMRLRPVTFRYLAHGDNAPLQYGLIAEEVADVYPELVARNKDGEVETVMYQFLAPMLLNEVQKQHRQIEEQQRTLDELQQRLEALERQVASGE